MGLGLLNIQHVNCKVKCHNSMEETIGTKFLLTIVKNHCCTDFIEDNGVKIVNI